MTASVAALLEATVARADAVCAAALDVACFAARAVARAVVCAAICADACGVGTCRHSIIFSLATRSAIFAQIVGLWRSK